MFKTRLETLGNDFGHFCNFENFLIFWKHFEVSTLHGTLGRKIFPKKCTPKHVQNIFGHFCEQFWAFLENLKIVRLFESISKTRLSMEHWAKKFFQKITPKHVQNRFGNFWERFWAFFQFWKFFDFLKTFRSLNPPWNTGQKNFSKKMYPKTCSKHFWTLLRTILGIFGKFENCSTFRKHLEDSTLHGKLGTRKFGKIIPKHVQNTLGRFWEQFWAFLENLKIVRLFENISKTRPSMEN